MGEFLIDIAQEEADMWHQKYLDLLKKIQDLQGKAYLYHQQSTNIIREEKAWQENYDAEQEIVRKADA